MNTHDKTVLTLHGLREYLELTRGHEPRGAAWLKVIDDLLGVLEPDEEVPVCDHHIAGTTFACELKHGHAGKHTAELYGSLIQWEPVR